MNIENMEQVFMSERITSENLDQVIKENKKIALEIENCCNDIRAFNNPLRISTPSTLGFRILGKHNLILFPCDNPYWSGAIFIRDGARIPVINTALPRVNQYFAAWHEVYHILFDKMSFDHAINNENYMEERKAELFAARMLIGDVNSYYNSLVDNCFEDKIFRCMAMFQAPYKAILIALYEEAVNNNNEQLQQEIKGIFDNHISNLPERFSALGLDDTLVLPSYIVNAESLASLINRSIEENPDSSCHRDNKVFFERTVSKLKELGGS